ncbi:plasmid partitioning protein RepB C-terminal domain-containing protein [Rubinisphaera sp.]|uniref:plasmid partitioning protein RepB C-terminal domain-containing protein n=1 Tax=Rubinisphaera sp. TaxID=2024857 RepID=UPI000C0FEB2F|nr:plasmid partitioning protein RepB C-terminal domain-containing protein [Rubinisphaera sp.]MBV11166.1 chromosome partitioning protein ParB [Rubinisphaera sp.]HCS52267.1 chromosome partitioning protein ParB [Planctomycetaceae bacterium]|tara:strand:+ start:176 stop:1072 length:897 start_codon:yes stop_codon:yes gene_type:complete
MKSEKRVHFACEQSLKNIPISRILPLRRITPGTQKTQKYRRIEASIREVGVIEPLVVHPQKDSKGESYMLLDGHMRLDILKHSGETTIDCLVAFDDEPFTYNHKVNRLSVIQEHFMLMKAAKSGVSEEAIAAALNVNVAKIREKKNLLVGICSEAVQLLRGKPANAGTFRQLRKAKPMRQIEMSELMCASSNFSEGYMKCLIAATPQHQLIESEQSKAIDGLSHSDMARMEREMESISKDFKQIEESYGKNVLNLVIVVGYLRKLLDNARIVRYLAGNYPELLTEFQKTVESKSLTES